MPQISSLSKRRMENYAQYRTTDQWTSGPRGTEMSPHSFPKSSTTSKDAPCLQSSMYDGDTITSKLKKEMNGRLHSSHLKDSLSPWLCSLDSPTPQQPSKWWWTQSSGQKLWRDDSQYIWMTLQSIQSLKTAKQSNNIGNDLGNAYTGYWIYWRLTTCISNRKNVHLNRKKSTT